MTFITIKVEKYINTIVTGPKYCSEQPGRGPEDPPCRIRPRGNEMKIRVMGFLDILFMYIHAKFQRKISKNLNLRAIPRNQPFFVQSRFRPFLLLKCLDLFRQNGHQIYKFEPNELKFYM